jgi:Zn-ribbon protein, possibly nucleic acid-binding
MNTTQVTAALYRLQQLDLEIDRFTGEKQSVANSLLGSASLRRLHAEYKVAQQQQRTAEQSQKEAEWTLEEYNQRLATQERRLYSGAIVNAKEMQALQQETQKLRALQSRQEEHVLEVIDIVESLVEATHKKEAALHNAEAQWEQERDQLETRQSQIEGQLQELQQKRQGITSGLEPDILKRYDTMRRSMQGRAVSKIDQNSCQWCRVILTPSELQQVRISAKLQTCTNCGRILYYER